MILTPNKGSNDNSDTDYFKFQILTGSVTDFPETCLPHGWRDKKWNVPIYVHCTHSNRTESQAVLQLCVCPRYGYEIMYVMTRVVRYRNDSI